MNYLIAIDVNGGAPFFFLIGEPTYDDETVLLDSAGDRYSGDLNHMGRVVEYLTKAAAVLEFGDSLSIETAFNKHVVFRHDRQTVNAFETHWQADIYAGLLTIGVMWLADEWRAAYEMNQFVLYSLMAE